MTVNHIFIFTSKAEKAVNELIDFGFIEGSSRVHPGQGTRNRKFYFKDFFLELLWVYDEKEIKSDITAPSKLYERSNYENNGCSPFGLCINYSNKDDGLFENHFEYKPKYLPTNMAIEVLTNVDSSTLPWTFRWKAIISDTTHDEPINNMNLTKVCFGVQKNKITNNYLKLIDRNSVICFEDTNSEYLKLQFDNNKSKKTKKFKSMPLLIEY